MQPINPDLPSEDSYTESPARSPLGHRLGIGALLFLCCVVGAGAYSLYRGQDADWDLKNYHFYNAFAYVNHRLLFDVAPAQLQSFNNPLVELPFYSLVRTFNDYPRVVAFTMALPAAIAIFFLLKTLLAAYSPDARERWPLIVFSLLFGIAGAAGIAQWGTAMDGWHIAALDAMAIFILVRSMATGRCSSLAPALAGVLCGIAAGLKLTASLSCVAVFGALLCVDRNFRKNVRIALIFGVAVTVGLILSAGPWMLTLYRDFRSPLFPYFNNLFRSPWWEPRRIVGGGRFGPKSLLGAVLFPLQMFHKNSLSSEPYLRDWHLPLLYIAGLAVLARLGFERIALSRSRALLPLNRQERFIVAYLVVFYVVWLGMFSIYRYLIPLELFSGWVFVILFRRLLWPTRIKAWLIVVLLVMWATKINPSWGRVPFGSRFFDVSAPELPKQSLVLLTSGRPLAYVIPFLRHDARFVGVNNNLVRPGMKTLLNAKIAALIAADHRPIYAMDLARHDSFGVLAKYGLAVDRGACKTIRTNLDSGGIALCEVRRLSPHPGGGHGGVPHGVALRVPPHQFEAHGAPPVA